MTKSAAMVIGYGSAGKRHAENLKKAGITPAVITSYPDKKNYNFYKDIKSAGAADFAVISSPTSLHFRHVKEAIKAGIKKILVEKPAAASEKELKKMAELAAGSRVKIWTAYNMRFLPEMKKLQAAVKKEKKNVRMVEATAGQYLPGWRKGKDYRKSYSASRKMGGGVDLDLSHELDYITWIFGPCKKILSREALKISRLKIDGPDYYRLQLKYPGFILNLVLDYIRPAERSIRLLGEDREILNINFLKADMTATYKTMLDVFLKGKKDPRLPELKESFEVMKLTAKGYRP